MESGWRSPERGYRAALFHLGALRRLNELGILAKLKTISCFPAVFDPLAMPFKASDFKGGEATGDLAVKLRGEIGLSDGGVYDNLGLEPIWKDHAIVLSSDGGAVFKFESEDSLLWRIQRYTAIQGNQALALRKRWLISSFLTGVMDGTCWGIGGLTSNYGPNAPQGYSPEISAMIANVRTDLDAFSEGADTYFGTTARPVTSAKI
jgi:NTE family protein